MYKFNFSTPGNRCNACNSLLYLTNDGEIIEEPIKILIGVNIGKSIIVKMYPKSHDWIPKLEKCKTDLVKLLSNMSSCKYFTTEFYSFIACLFPPKPI